jgi:anaerobic sulfite reductase subunit B
VIGSAAAGEAAPLHGSVPEAGAGPMAPVLHRIVGSQPDAADVRSIFLEPLTGARMSFRSGQFNMLTAFGVGEAAISISSAPADTGPLRHTVRDVGPVTGALCRLGVGDLVGVRGPFGTDWGTDRLRHDAPAQDAVVVAGGIGLAPLRGAVDELVARSLLGGLRVFVLVGAREPGQVIFSGEMEEWSGGGAQVSLTVDAAPAGWVGNVGLVTALLGGAGFQPERSTAFLCGPEVMMRFTARALVDLGMDPVDIRVSLERNMQCGVAWCGHCQLGPYLLCRDGPVLPYGGEVAELLVQRER